MHQGAQKTFYGLSIFVLMNGFFVISDPNLRMHPNDTNKFREATQKQFKTAFVQTIGDGPIVADLAAARVGVDNFYMQSTDAAMALLAPRPEEGAAILVARKVYTALNAGFNRFGKSNTSDGSNRSGVVAGEAIEWDYNPSQPPEGELFMTEEPVYNLVPN